MGGYARWLDARPRFGETVAVSLSLGLSPVRPRATVVQESPSESTPEPPAIDPAALRALVRKFRTRHR